MIIARSDYTYLWPSTPILHGGGCDRSFDRPRPTGFTGRRRRQLRKAGNSHIVRLPFDILRMVRNVAGSFASAPIKTTLPRCAPVSCFPDKDGTNTRGENL